MGFNNKARPLAGTTEKKTLKHFNNLFSAFPFETLLCGLEFLCNFSCGVLCNFYYAVSERINPRTVLPSALIHHSHFQRGTLFH